MKLPDGFNFLVGMLKKIAENKKNYNQSQQYYMLYAARMYAILMSTKEIPAAWEPLRAPYERNPTGKASKDGPIDEPVKEDSPTIPIGDMMAMLHGGDHGTASNRK